PRSRYSKPRRGRRIRVLETLGAKLDAAKVDEVVDVDSEADAAEERIWLYHDALESARAEWLRGDLSGASYERLLALRTPASFGLPMFSDDEQARRARDQEAAIGRRLRARNVTLNRVVTGLQWGQTAGDVAGIALGGGLVLGAFKTGGKWAAIKTVAVLG